MAHDPHDPIQMVAVSPNFAQDQTIFVATGQLSLKFGIYPVFKSTDGGVLWSVVQGLNNNCPIYQVLFSPAYAQDQTIFVVSSCGLFVSANQGSSWTQVSRSYLVSGALSPNFATDNTLFVLNNNKQIFISTNRGQTLTVIASPASLTGGLSTIAVSPSNDKTVLLGTVQDGIFLSTTSGSSWMPVTSGQTVPNVTALAFSPNYATDKTAFAATYGSGILVSTNGAMSWTTSNSGITDLNASSIALSPNYTSDSTLWVTTASAGVYQSTNGGASWSLGAKVNRSFSGLATIHYQSIAAASGGPNAQLYLGMYEGLWSSSNDAQSWSYIDTLPTRLIRHINLSPNFAKDGTIFCSTYGGGNLWSFNGGANWEFLNTGMLLAYTDASEISPNFAKDGTAFSSDGTGLQKTTNRGAGWQLQQGLGAGITTYPRALAVSPNFANDSTVFIGLSTTSSGSGSINGLYLSTDGGSTWQTTGLTSVNGGVISIGISPGFATDKTVYAASPSTGLYKSMDGGTTFSLLSVPSSSPGMALVALTPSFSTDQTIFAAPISGGIYKSMDGGTTWSLLTNSSGIRALDIQISPSYASDQTFYAGTLSKGLLRFTSGGAKVAAVPLPDSFITAVGLSPNLTNDHTLFAAGYRSLWKSTNNGNSWTTAAEPARMEESRQANSTYAPENPPSIIYSGMWSGVNPAPAASTNAYMATSEAQDTATLNFTGAGVGWITMKGPQQGMASITLDGVPQTTVNLYQPAANKSQIMVWSLRGLTCGLHTLTITALPKSAGQMVTIDAFDVWVDTCPSQ